MPAPRDAASAVTVALDARLTRVLGHAQPPASLRSAAALLQALRQAFPNDLARWFPLMPMGVPLGMPSGISEPTAAQAPRALGLDLADLRVLHRAIRVVWLAELVFGDRDHAYRWLSAPKRRLLGRVPLRVCQHGRYAAQIEQWLVDIDEGNGP
ncbi:MULTISPECIES: MbcA/ParS/Xre antitoxin family protein [Achromobacter]|uniref:MbcA/ParS/Xre antitoxin family protein n=1 Tax=Achromobacter TaxID=222 RepID=UPI000AAF5C9A|nr:MULTISPECIES: MbcA/ParS/Xre antitoxin family protein [Achromobacter]MCD0500775.1 MbcA/ParS/Xre antitoxin family protein [Achromobacter sp. MY14]MCW3151766.1 MbcA/ParS/Xre antitoxin family protein [Achromobacter spanius]